MVSGRRCLGPVGLGFRVRGPESWVLSSESRLQYIHPVAVFDHLQRLIRPLA